MDGEQPQFFDGDNPAWLNYDPDAEVEVAKVVFVDGPDGEFDYLVPDRLRNVLKVGARVRVPLGVKNRPAIAYCVALEKRDRASFVEPDPPKARGKVAPRAALCVGRRKRFRKRRVERRNEKVAAT